ncbi:MAG TPA: hypothetical protein GXZ30_07605 [Propionibacterium sp.]|jgi:hypothetical protein|nr:hypothetical protein [Propionibacterium sp.]
MRKIGIRVPETTSTAGASTTKPVSTAEISFKTLRTRKLATVVVSQEMVKKKPRREVFVGDWKEIRWGVRRADHRVPLDRGHERRLGSQTRRGAHGQQSAVPMGVKTGIAQCDGGIGGRVQM